MTTNSNHAFAPIDRVEVELGESLPAIPARAPDGRRFGGAHVFVRLHGRPIGAFMLALGDEGLTAAACATAIWTRFGAEIVLHLQEDGLPAVERLDAAGLPAPERPRCLRERDAVLVAPPSASVVVCTRNRPAMVARTLRSLRELAYPDVEIILVDGSAGDDTARVVREEAPGVRYLHVGDNNLCVARNRGLVAASGEIVAYTDDDVLVDPHWLTEHVRALESDERIACSTGVVVPLELQTPAQLWFEESGGFTQGYRPRVIGLDVEPEPGSLLPFATGRIGAGVSMTWRADVLRAIGGFDLSLDTLTPPWPLRVRHATAAEDLAAYFDALIAGYRIAFEPGAIVYHEHRRSYDALVRQLYWHGIGLGAYLTRCLVRHPDWIGQFVRLIPRGVRWGFAPGSPRNNEKSAGFPRELTRSELRGVVHGPFAYLRGLPRARRLRAAERTESGLG